MKGKAYAILYARMTSTYHCSVILIYAIIPAIHTATYHKEAIQMIYYTSDLYFGHQKVIQMDSRPFASIESMDETIILLWNDRVTENDDVYIVGDFAYRNSCPATWYLRQLQRKKHLIIGNYDWHTLQDPSIFQYFVSVDKMLQIEDMNRMISLCHFPVAEWNGKRYGGYHVFGHLHCRRDEVYQFMSRYDRAVNAGCMING